MATEEERIEILKNKFESDQYDMEAKFDIDMATLEFNKRLVKAQLDADEKGKKLDGLQHDKKVAQNEYEFDIAKEKLKLNKSRDMKNRRTRYRKERALVFGEILPSLPSEMLVTIPIRQLETAPTPSVLPTPIQPTPTPTLPSQPAAVITIPEIEVAAANVDAALTKILQLSGGRQPSNVIDTGRTEGALKIFKAFFF